MLKKNAILRRLIELYKARDSNRGSRNCYLNCLFILILFLQITMATPRDLHASTDLPFYPGEKLTFRLKWNFITAGWVTLEVLPFKEIDGKKYYHFLMNARSAAVLDPIYKVRNRVEAFTDLDMTHSIGYRKLENAGKYKADTIVEFDWAKRLAKYSNFGKKRKPIKILPGTLDPLSIFFYTRFLDLFVNYEINHPVTDGKRCIMGSAKVIKRETIKVPNGEYDTFLIEPQLKNISSVFRRNKDAKIKLWVSADARKIPIKIVSKVVVGSFCGELISTENVISLDKAAHDKVVYEKK